MKLKQFNFKKINSTNQTAIRLLKNPNNNYGLVVTENQSNGRGQYGRKWISLKGNIFLSFFYKLEKINLPITSLTKKNCYLVKDAISKYYKKKITFKSPNDLLIEKKKICGILQEIIYKSNKKYLITGIGININKSPYIKNYPTTNLNEIANKHIRINEVENSLRKIFENNLLKIYSIKGNN